MCTPPWDQQPPSASCPPGVPLPHSQTPSTHSHDGCVPSTPSVMVPTSNSWKVQVFCHKARPSPPPSSLLLPRQHGALQCPPIIHIPSPPPLQLSTISLFLLQTQPSSRASLSPHSSLEKYAGPPLPSHSPTPPRDWGLHLLSVSWGLARSRRRRALLSTYSGLATSTKAITNNAHDKSMTSEERASEQSHHGRAK